jgi:serine/threonine protein kinase
MQRCPKCQKDYPKGVDFCPKDGSRTIPAPSSTPAPRKAKTEIGNYVLVKKLGEGGMGVVFEAEHKMIQKRVALKMLHADKANDAQIYERFKREAKISSQIKNPHIVDITDFGQTDNGDLYLVMEYLEGQDLGHLLDQRKFISLAEAQHILIQSSQALAAAHRVGVVHRDLKPDNIFLITKDGDGRYVKLLDFGIAKIAEASAALTKAGMIIGTPEYMSPEQCEGRPVDARSDLYSLGVIAYHMLTGRVPFSHEHFSRVLLMHSSEPPTPLRKMRPGLQITPVIEATIMKCLEKRREDRYQSMDELLAALNTWNVGSPSASPSHENELPATQIASAADIMAQSKLPMPTLSLEFTEDNEDQATQTGDAPEEVMSLGNSMVFGNDDDNAATIQPDDGGFGFGQAATIAPGGMMRPPPGARPVSPTIIPNVAYNPPRPSDTQPTASGVIVPSTLDPQKVLETTALPKIVDQLLREGAASKPEEEPKNSRLLVILASAIGVVVFSILLYVFVFAKKAPAPVTPPPKIDTTSKKTAQSTVPPATINTKTLEERVTITIKAKPSDGVEVRIEGNTEILGTLPSPINLPRGSAEVKLEFSKKGFNKVVKAVTPSTSQELNIVLTPIKKVDAPKEEVEDPNDPIKDPFKNP